MQVENPIRLVRELKGAPISIILVLSFSTLRVTQEWLERATGYTDKPVSQALAYLQEIGLVDHTRAGWQLTGDGKQLPLGLALEEGTTSPQPSPEGEGEEEMSRNISDSITTTTLINLNLREINSSSSNNGEASRNFSESDTQNTGDSLQKALESAGIKGAKLRELLEMGGFCAQDVPAWEAELRKRYGNRYRPGLLVRVLESGEQAPVMPERFEICKGCHCYPCDCEDEEEVERAQLFIGG